MTRVSAVILYNENGEILICQRGAGGCCEYLWEFPGGKEEPKETAAECAVRECREELNIEVGALDTVGTSFYSYPDRDISFTFFKGKILSGEPTQTVHKSIRWVTPQNLSEYAFCPAETWILEQLKREAE